MFLIRSASVTYFQGSLGPQVAVEAAIVANYATALSEYESAVARIEGAGLDPASFLPTPRRGSKAGDTKRKLDDARRRLAEEEAIVEASLSEIRHQVISDAQGAWAASDLYFAPVLFQKLKRAGAGWESMLVEITAVGWRLDSWQVIGPAPEPFGTSVTLLQALFVR